MRLTLITLLSLVSITLNAQTAFENTLNKFTTEIGIPFSTPSELPLVGEIAEDEIEIMENEEEINKLKAVGLKYPEITEELYLLLGDNSGVLNGSAQLFPYGKFKVGETTFLIILETGREARSQMDFQSLAVLAFDKDHTFKDIRYLMSFDQGYEYDEEDNTIMFYLSVSSKLELIDSFLTVTTEELNQTQIVKEDETEEEESTYTSRFNYLPSTGQFEFQ